MVGDAGHGCPLSTMQYNAARYLVFVLGQNGAPKKDGEQFFQGRLEQCFWTLVKTEKLPQRHSEDSTVELSQGDSSWKQETSERKKDQKGRNLTQRYVCVYVQCARRYTTK
jgi:hypothetical protein